MRLLARLLALVLVLAMPGGAQAFDPPAPDPMRGATMPARRIILPEVDQGSGGDVSKFSVRIPGWSVGQKLEDIIRDFALANLPDYSAAVLGKVAADDGTPQSDKIMEAASKVPASGGNLRLPCGKMAVDKTVLITNARVRTSSATMYCSHLSSIASFTDGDVVRITGAYSGLSDIAIDHIDQEGGAARTSGYTVNLDSGYNYIENATLRHCFVCIRMGAQGGWQKIDTVMMQSMADGIARPGSGGILVDNTLIGAENWIMRTIIMSNFTAGSGVRYPSFGIKLANTGGTHLIGNDVISVMTDLLIAPGNGQTVQATRAVSNYFDSAQRDNVVLRPTGSGYIFDTVFEANWITNTNVPNTTGLLLDGRGTTTLPPGVTAAIRGVRWSNGLIASTMATGSGVACADPTPTDLTITGSPIAGWGVGVDFANGCSHATIADNSIGNYSPFNVATQSRTNFIGVRLGPNSDWIDVHNNRLFGNSVAAVSDASTGSHVSIKDNLGYNPVGPLPLPATGSGMMLKGGHSSAVFAITGGTGVTVTMRSAASTASLPICNGTPCILPLAANQNAILNYTTPPTIVQAVQ